MDSPRSPMPVVGMDKKDWAALRATRSRPSDRAPTGLAAPRFDQAQGIQPLPITINLSAIVGGGLLAWAPLVILIALYLEFA